MEAFSENGITAVIWGGFQIDRGPIITVTTPAPRARVGALDDGYPIVEAMDAAHPITGTLQTGVDGTPITSVSMSLTRQQLKAGYEIWTGTVWVPVPTKDGNLDVKWTAPVDSETPGTWQRDFGLPPAEELRDGHYHLTVGITDQKGRRRAAHATFVVRRNKSQK